MENKRERYIRCSKQFFELLVLSLQRLIQSCVLLTCEAEESIDKKASKKQPPDSTKVVVADLIM